MKLIELLDRAAREPGPEREMIRDALFDYLRETFVSRDPTRVFELAIDDHLAVVRERWEQHGATQPAPKRYCGVDHCSGFWNLPCDDPKHPRPTT